MGIGETVATHMEIGVPGKGVVIRVVINPDDVFTTRRLCYYITDPEVPLLGDGTMSSWSATHT